LEKNANSPERTAADYEEQLAALKASVKYSFQNSAICYHFIILSPYQLQSVTL